MPPIFPVHLTREMGCCPVIMSSSLLFSYMLQTRHMGFSFLTQVSMLSCYNMITLPQVPFYELYGNPEPTSKYPHSAASIHPLRPVLSSCTAPPLTGFSGVSSPVGMWPVSLSPENDNMGISV